MSSFSRAAGAALRAVGRRPTVAPATTITTANRPAAATTPLPATKNQTRAYVKESRNRPQASNRDKSEPSHAGTFARTDDSITVEYPQDHELPSSEPITGAGRAGLQVYPTLATFSLQGNVGVVTGGARGLGLVMGQGMVVSGADLAIVDMNSKSHNQGPSSVCLPVLNGPEAVEEINLRADEFSWRYHRGRGRGASPGSHGSVQEGQPKRKEVSFRTVEPNLR